MEGVEIRGSLDACPTITTFSFRFAYLARRLPGCLTSPPTTAEQGARRSGLPSRSMMHGPRWRTSRQATPPMPSVPMSLGASRRVLVPSYGASKRPASVRGPHFPCWIADPRRRSTGSPQRPSAAHCSRKLAALRKELMNKLQSGADNPGPTRLAFDRIDRRCRMTDRMFGSSSVRALTRTSRMLDALVGDRRRRQRCRPSRCRGFRSARPRARRAAHRGASRGSPSDDPDPAHRVPAGGAS